MSGMRWFCRGGCFRPSHISAIFFRDAGTTFAPIHVPARIYLGGLLRLRNRAETREGLTPPPLLASPAFLSIAESTLLKLGLPKMAERREGLSYFPDRRVHGG